ncbi:intraflagellar transport protein 22 homolog isoform X2 [Phalacrocorax aristotelis]|uniref:intraflagellar transport protein 22 homolog isoform X2 n=1 Tax=Phalacrocorax aristotelis TaxID=126867 RepID=UPI003F4BE5AF
MLRAKVLLVGPRQAGKSVLANFVSESIEGIGSYNPTQGVRILEYENPNLNGNTKGAVCRFELWDCSGDQKFETCWPALLKDSHGVIIIFNPELPSHLKEIEMWYSCFVQQQPLLDSQCLLVAHHKPGSAGDTENLSLACLFHLNLPKTTRVLCKNRNNEFQSSSRSLPAEQAETNTFQLRRRS